MRNNLELYKSLYLIRYCEKKIIDLYHENEMRTPMHMSFGQEYIPVGVCSGLDMKCDITSSYRSHANFLARTGDHRSFFFEMYGKEDTIGRGKCGSMHLGDPNKGHILSSGIVASQIPAATGIAFANKYKNLKILQSVSSVMEQLILVILGKCKFSLTIQTPRILYL